MSGTQLYALPQPSSVVFGSGMPLSRFSPQKSFSNGHEAGRGGGRLEHPHGRSRGKGRGRGRGVGDREGDHGRDGGWAQGPEANEEEQQHQTCGVAAGHKGPYTAEERVLVRRAGRNAAAFQRGSLSLAQFIKCWKLLQQ